MTERPHIVIIAKGGPGWLGGRQYSINLLKSLLLHRAQSAAPFDVSVLVRGEEELPHYAAVAGEMKVIDAIENRLEGWSLANRLRWYWKRYAGGWTNPRFEEPLRKIGTTFAYPFSSAVIPSADWISDFQYDHYPDRMSAKEIADRKAEFSTIVAKAQRVVLSSPSAERDCHRIFPETVGRTSVLQFRVFADAAWTAADPQAVVAKYHLPQPFLLISNWLLPTKNHALALEALVLIPPEKRQGIHIAITGDLYDYRNPGFYNGFLNRIHTLGLGRNVSVLGVIPKADQIQLLRASAAYLQPSLFEGWNTGVEEARLLGKPMLVSDIPVHREQDPPGALFFDPHDAADLAGKIAAFFEGDGPRGFSRASEDAGLSAYQALQVECGRTLASICGAA